jgi:hypothetical protein
MGVLQVWSLASLDLLAYFDLPEPPEHMVTVGPGLIAMSSGEGVLLWRPGDDPDALHHIAVGRKSTKLEVVGDGENVRLVCVSDDGSLTCVDTRTGELAVFDLNSEFGQTVGLRAPPWVVGLHGTAVIAVEPPRSAG